MPKVTIIVPVYNAEHFLCRCIDSVLLQKFDNWELILVDDGSIDKSGAICDKYASNDCRIHVLHKENGGVSSARNLGLDNANGLWITFVDADDELLDCFLDVFISNQQLSKCDFAFHSKYRSVYKGEEINNIVGEPTRYSNNNLRDFIIRYIDAPILKAVHSNFFRNKIIQLHHIRFDDKIRSGEDHMFVLDYLQYIDSVEVVNGFGYIYYLPDIYALKYRLRMSEILYKFELMENRMAIIERKAKTDLKLVVRDKWKHGLAGIDIYDLYNCDKFSEFLKIYQLKVGKTYNCDMFCNREARVASMLIQMAGHIEYKNESSNLQYLLLMETNKSLYCTKSFPLTVKIVLFTASLRSPLLLKFLLLLYGYIFD